MFRDTDEELKRLESELLTQEQEETPREQEDMEGTVVFSPIKPHKFYNTDVLDTDLDAFSREVENPARGDGITVLVLLAILLTAGIVCAVIWWVLRLRGVIG